MTVGVAFTYMTATLIQLDLAARTCPPETAGTVFAVLMALENLSASASTWLGGVLYDEGRNRWGSRGSFQVLVLIGSALTACCWLVVPLLTRDAATRRTANQRDDAVTRGSNRDWVRMIARSSGKE